MMNSEIIVICVVSLILGVLIEIILNNICKCKNIEGHVCCTSPPCPPGVQPNTRGCHLTLHNRLGPGSVGTMGPQGTQHYGLVPGTGKCYKEYVNRNKRKMVEEELDDLELSGDWRHLPRPAIGDPDPLPHNADICFKDVTSEVSVTDCTSDNGFIVASGVVQGKECIPKAMSCGDPHNCPPEFENFHADEHVRSFPYVFDNNSRLSGYWEPVCPVFSGTNKRGGRYSSFVVNDFMDWLSPAADMTSIPEHITTSFTNATTRDPECFDKNNIVINYGRCSRAQTSVCKEMAECAWMQRCQ